MEPQNPQVAQPENQTDSNQSSATSPPIAEALRNENADWVASVVEALGETTIIVPREYIVAACQFLKSTPTFEFNFLSDLCGFDRGPEEEPRFEVNYHLFSTKKHYHVRLKVLLNEDDPHVPS